MRLCLTLFFSLLVSSCNTLSKDKERDCTNYVPECGLLGQKLDCTYNDKGCKTCTCTPVGKPNSGDPTRPAN